MLLICHQVNPKFNVVRQSFVHSYRHPKLSVDIQMKFKNQKWIAREVGIENWEGVEKDNCDTYQNQFYAQSFEMLENRDMPKLN